MEIVHGSVYGYRKWVLFYNRNTRLPELHPLVAGIVKWPYGVTEAHCYSTRHKDLNIIPEPECRCGLYANKVDYRTYKSHLPYVFGRVELFGRVEHHSAGYRAQYARIDALDPVTMCVECSMKGIPKYLRLDSDDTTILFGPHSVSRGRIRKSLRKAVRSLCQDCAYALTFKYGYPVEPPYPDELTYVTASSRPLFEILTRLYCDGRLME